MTARKSSHADFTVTCFAQQHHFGASHLVMLHRYQPPVPLYRFFLPTTICCCGTNNTPPEGKSLFTNGGVSHQVEESKSRSLYRGLLFQYNIVSSCVIESRNEGVIKLFGHASQPHSGSPPIDIAHVRASRPPSRSSIP
jgi:hypothetical protein